MKNNLKEIMEMKSISINDLAKDADVTVATVLNWRKAETIKPKTQRKIAKALKIDVGVVFG
jgi:transcriptional regulator with XRE-family HTH domain